MEKQKKLGELLKEYREVKFPGMGLRRVALEVGIDYAHLFRLEANQYTPSDESLIKLISAYGISDPNIKLEIFNMARLTPTYQEVVNEAVKFHKKEETPEAFMQAFYRKQSKKDKKKDD